MSVYMARLAFVACLILLAGVSPAAWDPWKPSPAGIAAPERLPETNPFRLAGAMTISAYRRAVSPLLPGQCQFHPSCSCFALQAVCERGLLNGTIMSAERILRCHGFAVLGRYPVRSQDGLFDDPLDQYPSPLPWLSFAGL